MIAPLPDNETERLRWLRESGILDSPAEKEFDDLTQLACQVFSVPVAAITLIDEQRQWYKSQVGLAYPQTPRAVAFCAHTILQTEVLAVSDATQDARFADNPSVTGDEHFRFYAGAPLITSEGLVLGSLCVIDTDPKQLDDQQKSVLEVLARQAASRIELQRQVALQEKLIVQQKLAEQRLAETEERLLFAVEGVGVGTFHWNLISKSIVWSDQSKALFGLPASVRMTRERLSASLHPDDRDRTQSAIEQAIDRHETYDTEYRALWPDGSEHWLWARGRGYYDDDGRPLRFEGTIQDISARKSAAQQQQTFLRDVLASVTEGRLLLSSSPAQLPAVLAPLGASIPLTKEDGLRELRQRTQEAAKMAGMSEERQFDLVTAASEAGMNAVVHAGGGTGTVSAGGNGAVQVRVEDQGTGITMENLPKAALARGFSTKATLGHGLKLMLETVDHLYLLTDPTGTTIVLEQEREPPLPAWL